VRNPTRLAHAASAALATLLLVASCDETVGGNVPVGGDEATEASLQRFVRRAHLDLAGTPPDDATLAADVAALRSATNPPAARRALVQRLMDEAPWARVWVEELENRVLGGETLASRYQFLCSIVRSDQAACRTCTAADACDCTCPTLVTLLGERTALETATGDLRGGAATSAVERRYAMALGYYALIGTPDARARALFDDFLGRPAEAEEMANGAAMIQGGLNGGPAGLLFQRLGGTYPQLLDIVWESEVYREAIVTAVFERYLARRPSAAERTHFVAMLDAAAPDARPIIEDVLTSKEYFEP
jgi:hypothetical protein